MALLLCGCATQNSTNNSPKENTSIDPVGTYNDVSFSDTNSLYVDFKFQSTGNENEEQAMVITSTDSGYTYRDTMFSGRLTNNGGGDFTAKKETVITTNPALIQLAELELELSPYTFYKVYENYIIKKVPLSNATISGELPSEGKQTTCFVNIQHITFSTYTLSFSSDGSCEIMTIFNNGVCSVSGTYSVKGSIISLTLTKGTFYGENFSGNIEKALYMEDNTLYDTVYRKNSK